MEALMQLRQVITYDGSTSVYTKHYDENYHSVHGSIQESEHVFIKAGLNEFLTQKKLEVFEMGFGTGLNALLTALQAEKFKVTIHYTSVEKFPLDNSFYESMNFCTKIDESNCQEIYSIIHSSEWEIQNKILNHFYLTKIKTDLNNFNSTNPYDIIFYDAFAPSAQPELWNTNVFNKMYNILKPGGILVTYCAKGEVKRNLKSVGFQIETLPGPIGKREMTRARKLTNSTE